VRKVSWVVLTGLVGLVGWGVVSPMAWAQGGKVSTTVSPPQLIFEQAIKATTAKKYAEAERLYRELLKIEPDVAPIWGNLGLLVGNQGRTAEAVRYLEKAVTLEPNTPTFRAHLAIFQYRQGQVAEAETNSRKVLEREPKNRLALANLADVLIRQKKYADAIPPLRLLRSLEGNAPEAQTEIALIVCLDKSGSTKEALVLAQKRAKRLSKDLQAQLLWGDMARLAGAFDEAEQAYTIAQNLDPKHPGAVQGLIAVAGLRGDRASAIAQIKKRLQTTPDNPQLHFQLGYLIYTDTSSPEAERLPIAEKHFARATSLNPKNPLFITYQALSVMLQGQSRLETAERLFTAALTLNPKNSMAHKGLAFIYEKTDRFPTAILAYRQALQAEPQDKDARRGLAGVLYITGAKQDAYREMETIANQDPKETRVLAELASWQVADNQLPLAQKTYESLLARNPKDTASWIGLAQIHQREKRTAEARTCYEKALTADPRYAPATLLLGDLFLEEGKTDEAVVLYRRFLELDPKNNPVRWQLTLTLRQQKRYEDALTEARQLTLQNEDPNRIEYQLIVPRLYLDKNRNDDALAELQRLHRAEPDSDAVRFVLSTALEQANRLSDAETVLKEAVQQQDSKPRKSPVPYAVLGGFYERQKRWAEAATAFQDALVVDARNGEVLRGLIRARTAENQPQKAVEFVEALALADKIRPHETAVLAVEFVHQERKTPEAYLSFTQRLVEKYPKNRIATLARAKSLLSPTATTDLRQEGIQRLENWVKLIPSDKEATALLTELKRMALPNTSPTPTTPMEKRP